MLEIVDAATGRVYMVVGLNYSSQNGGNFWKVLYYTVLYYTILYYPILSYPILYYTILHYTTLH